MRKALPFHTRSDGQHSNDGRCDVMCLQDDWLGGYKRQITIQCSREAAGRKMADIFWYSDLPGSVEQIKVHPLQCTHLEGIFDEEHDQND